MSEDKLTKDQAFLAMYTYLDDYYQLTKSDDVGSLLGGMSLLPDGGSADPRVQQEWNDAVEKVMSGEVNAMLQIKYT